MVIIKAGNFRQRTSEDRERKPETESYFKQKRSAMSIWRLEKDVLIGTVLEEKGVNVEARKRRVNKGTHKYERFWTFSRDFGFGSALI